MGGGGQPQMQAQQQTQPQAQQPQASVAAADCPLDIPAADLAELFRSLLRSESMIPRFDDPQMATRFAPHSCAVLGEPPARLRSWSLAALLRLALIRTLEMEVLRFLPSQASTPTFLA